MSSLSETLVWLQALFLPSPTGGATCLTFFWRSPRLIWRWPHPSQKGASPIILVISLSTSPPPPPRLFWRTLELVPIACQWLATHTHTFTHRSTPMMMIPNSRIDTIIPQGSPTTYLCFVKYGNDSININTDVTCKLVYSPSIQTTSLSVLSPAKKKKKTISTEESLLDINLYIFIYTAHTETGTVGQRMTGAVIRETDSLLGSHKGGKDWRRCSECGEDLLAPPHCSPSDRFLLPSNPQRCTYAWGASTHSSLLGFVCVDMWNSRAETLNRQSCMWGCHGYSILAHLCFFFLSNLTFLLFFYYCYFLFFWVFLVLSTKVILNVVLSLSRFILSSNLVFICPLYSVFLSIMFVLALIMREAGTQRLKFSCKRSCLVKLCCILKWFFKEENDLIVNKVLDSGGVLSQP